MANDLRYSLGLDGSKFDTEVSKALAGIKGLSGALAALGATAEDDEGYQKLKAEVDRSAARLTLLK